MSFVFREILVPFKNGLIESQNLQRLDSFDRTVDYLSSNERVSRICVFSLRNTFISNVFVTAKNMSDDHEDGVVDLYWDEMQLKVLKSV